MDGKNPSEVVSGADAMSEERDDDKCSVETCEPVICGRCGHETYGHRECGDEYCSACGGVIGQASTRDGVV